METLVGLQYSRIWTVVCGGVSEEHDVHLSTHFLTDRGIVLKIANNDY
jgi:hypothetical protein